VYWLEFIMAVIALGIVGVEIITAFVALIAFQLSQ
jgi:hypothetical protein